MYGIFLNKLMANKNIAKYYRDSIFDVWYR